MENVFVDETELSADDVDVMNGFEAGEAFARRHIVDKLNLFIDEYRRNGYSETYVRSFIDGMNDVTGGNICLDYGDSDGAGECESDELEEAGTSVQEMQEAC